MVVNISSRRGSGGTNQTRYRLRRIFLLAIIVTISFYVLCLHLILNNVATKSNINSAPTNDIVLNTNEPVAVIAHAISLIKCSKGSSVTGFLDAAAILRHSIHKQSIHYKPPTNSTTTISSAPRSRYSYKMYGIVHTSCADHAKVLELYHL